MPELTFDLVTKTYDFYVEDYEFKTHKMRKLSVLIDRDLKFVSTPRPYFKKKKKKNITMHGA